MPPKAMWKGQIRLSLLSIPIRLHTATESGSRIQLHQLHGQENCYRRVKYRRVCPEHGELSNDEIVPGYEYEKDRYVVIYQEELDQIKRQGQRSIDIKKFVPSGELPTIYRDNSYYATPDGAIAEDAYRVVRQAAMA